MESPASEANPPVAVPLAGLAVVLALLDVLLSRGLLRLVGNVAHRDVAAEIETLSRFVRNFSAVTTTIGLLAVTRAALRSPALDLGIGRRIVLGGLAGVFLPVLGIALLMPDGRTTIVLVLVGIASGYTLAMVHAFSAFSADAPIEQRVACVIAMLFAMTGLGGYAAQLWASIGTIDGVFAMKTSLRNVTELCYFALPVSLGIGLLTKSGPRIGPARAAIALVALALAAGGVLLLASTFPADFALLLYGALRLEALDAAPASAYALLLGLSAAGVALGLSSADPSDRRLALGTALVLLAGAGGGSPFALSLVVLGTTMIALVPRRAPAAQGSSSPSDQSVS